MKRFYASLIIAAAAALGCQMMPANAAPPTVTSSPGYDARLQEGRAGQAHYEPAGHYPAAVHRRHVRRVHDGAH